MTFTGLSHYFEELEKTTSRLAITEILSRLFKKVSRDDIGKVTYLLQGRVAPLYEPIEFGMADRMIMRAIATGLTIDPSVVQETFKKSGDLGKTVEHLKHQLSRTSFHELPISRVFAQLDSLARTSGEGSQEKKISLLSILIRETEPLAARYIVRILLGKLRLGFSDMTILDALSWMLTGGKSARKTLERAYNVRPDLGYIAQTVKSHGVKGITHMVPRPGTPILMARANRLTSATEILDKIGRCAVEYKYDGLRLQVHFQKIKNNHVLIKMYSRNLEDVTHMFPDIKEAMIKQIKVDGVILEGEVVAYNPHTGVSMPFQDTMQRKRKHDIEAKAKEIPVKLFVFELLYINGESLLDSSYLTRKQKLKDVIKNGKGIIYAQEFIVKEAEEIEKVFDESVELHFEGIIAKKLDGVYEAGIRGWNWIKFKKAMDKKLIDTVDVLVMGYTRGEGKRTAFGVGQFLTGVYDSHQDKFVTVTKIGTGLSDDQFREFYRRVKPLEAKEKPPLYEVDKLLTPDVWLEPSLVVEISGDEITRSPIHTAGRVLEPSKSGKAFSVKEAGFALRFPRLVGFRDDRRPEDVTTIREIRDLYQKQGK